LQESDSGVVIDRFRVGGLYEGEIVCDSRRVGHEFADPRCGLAVLSEAELAGYHRKAELRGRHVGEALPGADRFRQIRALEILQARLVVEQLHLRRAARLE
jgi:hypothetical protein